MKLSKLYPVVSLLCSLSLYPHCCCLCLTITSLTPAYSNWRPLAAYTSSLLYYKEIPHKFPASFPPFVIYVFPMCVCVSVYMYMFVYIFVDICIRL